MSLKEIIGNKIPIENSKNSLRQVHFSPWVSALPPKWGLLIKCFHFSALHFSSLSTQHAGGNQKFIGKSISGMRIISSHAHYNIYFISAPTLESIHLRERRSADEIKWCMERVKGTYQLIFASEARRAAKTTNWLPGAAVCNPRDSPEPRVAFHCSQGFSPTAQRAGREWRNNSKENLSDLECDFPFAFYGRRSYGRFIFSGNSLVCICILHSDGAAIESKRPGNLPPNLALPPLNLSAKRNHPPLNTCRARS